MIGILAGMGPMSTAPFIDMLMKQWQQEFQVLNDVDFPHVVIYSLPTPFYVDRKIDHDKMQQVILAGLHKLESWGVTLIAMACNTAYLYFESLQKALNIKLLNIVQETLSQVSDSAKCISLLATKPTFDSQLYQSHIKDLGKTLVFKASWQSRVDALILAVKQDSEAVEEMALSLLTQLVEANVEVIIIGCTDISSVITKVAVLNKVSVELVDSSHALVTAVIRKYTQA